MSAGVAVPLERARETAERLVRVLAPACERIEIAGSIRRGAPRVSDVEIVAVPRAAADLFGAPDPSAPNELEVQIDRLILGGHLEPRLTSAGLARRGRRYQALRAVKSGIAVDLFSVLPPATWGAVLAIRTGPADFSRELVTRLRARGMRCEDGRVIGVMRDAAGERALPTPTEQDFFRACGVAWVPPEERR